MDEQYAVSAWQADGRRACGLQPPQSGAREHRTLILSLLFSYLKAVDRTNEWTVSAFLVPGSASSACCRALSPLTSSTADIKMLILHEHRHDDGIRNFFLDVWELLVKVRSAARGLVRRMA